MAAGETPFKFNEFITKAEQLSKHTTNQAKYSTGLKSFRAACATSNVAGIKKNAKELSELLTSRHGDSTVDEVKREFLSVHHHIKKTRRGLVLSRPKEDSRSSPSTSIKEYTKGSIKSDESTSLHTNGRRAPMHERKEKDTKQNTETIAGNTEENGIEKDLDSLVKHLNQILKREEIENPNATLDGSSTTDVNSCRQRCQLHIHHIKTMFDSAINAYNVIGLQKMKEERGKRWTEEGLKKEIIELKETLKTKEVSLKRFEEWVRAITEYADKSKGDRPSFRDLKTDEKRYSEPKRAMNDLLEKIDVMKFQTKKAKLLEDWIDILATGADDVNTKVPNYDCPPEFRNECNNLKKTLESLSQKLEATHMSSKEMLAELQLLEADIQYWDEVSKIEDSKSKIPSAKKIRQCRILLAKKKAADSTIIESKEMLAELGHLEADIQHWDEVSKIEDSKSKIPSAKKIRQCRILLAKKKAADSTSIERNNDIDKEVRRLAKEVQQWDDVQTEEGFSKDPRPAVQELRNIRMHLNQRKQEEFGRNERLHHELDSFENELRHWKDFTDINDLAGDSSMISSLRQLRVKLLRRKRQSVEIKENMEAKMVELTSLYNYIFDTEMGLKEDERPAKQPNVKAAIQYVQKWKEDRQITQSFVDEMVPLLIYANERLKTPPYSFREAKRRADGKPFSQFLEELQFCVYQIVDCIEVNSERFSLVYVELSKAVHLLGDHYFTLTSETYQPPKKEKSFETIIQSITDRLVHLGITKHGIAKLVEEKNSLALRLSKAAGAKLRENNPNIADLSDPNRPTKLSERYSELYDNQWTNAFEKLTDGKGCTEKRAIDSLLEVFQMAFTFCTDISNTQAHLLKSTILCPVQDPKSSHIGANDQKLSSEHAVMISELRKGTVDTSIIDLQKHFKKQHAEFADNKTKDFTDECVRLSWMMCVQTPPLWVDFQTKSDDSFNKNVYKSYTATGPKVEYVVWPALYLSNRGGLLLKGVAQGKASRK